MKRTLLRLVAVVLASLLLCGALPVTANAATDVTAAFTDANFRAAVRTALGIGASAPINKEDCADVVVLDVRNKGIASLAGIENFTGMMVLYCSGNNLTTLDFAGCTSLAWLECGENPLTALSLTSNVNLTRLDCMQTPLEELILDNNVYLENLFIPGNQNLAALDVTKNVRLKELNVADCALTSLDVSKNALLVTLICVGNKLPSLTIKSLAQLQTVDCSDNLLTSLQITDCYNLSTLACENNQLTALDVSQFFGLMALICGGNKLTTLSVSANGWLTNLRCSGNLLSYLDVTNNFGLQHLECADNKLSVLVLTPNEQLVTLDCSGNGIAWLDLSKCKKLFTLDCAENQLIDLDIRGLNDLRLLYVNGNKMQSKLSINGLPLIESLLYEFVFDDQYPNGTDITSKFTDPNMLAAVRAALGKGPGSKILQEECVLVKELDLDGWEIESLAGIEYFTNLERLNVMNNNLTQLTLTLPKLKDIDCSGNQLTSINLTGCPMLEDLDCSDNRLEQLNLDSNTALATLNCSKNLLTTLWLTSNLALRQLNCSNNLMLGIDLTVNTQLRNLNVTYNFMADPTVMLLPSGGGVSYIFYPQNTLTQDVTEYFTDPVFLAEVLAALGKQPGDSISAIECRDITMLDLAGKGITSLAGLMFLTNLEWLDCSDNKITGMDISNNSKLQYLDATMNWMGSQSDVISLRPAITTMFFFNPQKYSGEIITDVFIDPAFRDAIREAMGKDPDDPIGSLDCAQMVTLDVHGKGITNVSGIEKFTGLKNLNLAGNELSSRTASRWALSH